MERKYIGQVAVDSGQLMIIDPMAIEKHWKLDYEEVCSITRNGERAGMLNDTLACAFQTGSRFGDGLYEVYAHYSVPDKKFVADKRISKVEIILIDELDE
ncbi:hypothetical protein [Bacillus safensis]|uniref:Uncharacterized protein n=1 Tax=Bacillus safensis TaxID=561879 RepID=A0A1L6ZPA5_BACIA|nr:hypothetical protein [Bacillus safensis]APT48351.1 hypothetical protein BSA145_21035 [Bacillus safensis]